MGHSSFGVFLLDFVVCSEPLSQSWVASIVMDLASLTFLTNSAFFGFCDTSSSFHRVPRAAVTPSCHRRCLPSFLSSRSFFLSIETRVGIVLPISSPGLPKNGG